MLPVNIISRSEQVSLDRQEVQARVKDVLCNNPRDKLINNNIVDIKRLEVLGYEIHLSPTISIY